MKTNTWIVVANSSRAIIVSDEGPNAPLSVVQVLRHDDGRRNSAGLVTDRPGRSQSPTGTGTTLAPRTDPHRNSRDHFAAEIAASLDENRRHNRYSDLVIAASEPFFGVLLGHLDPQVGKRLTKTIERDLGDVPLDQLRARVIRA